MILKCWNHSITTRNNAVTYYRTLEEILWHLGLIKITIDRSIDWLIDWKNIKNFQKAWKQLQNSKLAFLASGCSSVASHGRGVTGGWLGGITGVGGISAAGGGGVGGAIGGGVNSGGVFNL